jgi:signal transduction histidine kinase/BarA-like signal transduction histidine kinase
MVLKSEYDKKSGSQSHSQELISKEEQLIEQRKEALKQLKNNMKTLDEEIRKTEQLRTRFLSNVSHEIKTPLNSILSATTLLQQKPLDKETKELVNTIHHSGQYLFSLLNDVLDYYKLAARQLTLDQIHFRLADVLQEVITFYEKKAVKQQIHFQASLSSRLPQFLQGDANRMKQILTQLLDNAFKFTPAGGQISLSVKPLAFSEGKYEILFSIRDTGIGISEEDQPKIWEKFNMGDMSLTRENPGTGLGLALSRRLCHLLGGKMFLESQPEKGSTFSFTVKMFPGHPVAPESHPSKNTLNILLVEDNSINQKLTQKILSRQGFRVDVADNGQIAVEKFRQSHYDLIFMDIQMPVMDGREATRQIRKIEKTQRRPKRVKIIALTANSQKEDKENCLAAGMDDYLSKPLNLNKFPITPDNFR